jgi:hypothetical protein
MMKPTRYEYEQPTQIHGASSKVSTKIDCTARGNLWVATLHMTTVPATSAGDAQNALREELLRVAATLGGGK